MNGYSIQRITDKVDEGDSAIVYSNIFYDSVNKFITPVYYVAKMVEVYKNEKEYSERRQLER